MSSFTEIQKNMEKDMEKKHAERIARCEPVARKLLKVIASHADTVPLGDVEPTDERFVPIAKDILQFLIDENVVWSDREFVFQLMQQAISLPQSLALQSLDRSWQVLITGILGKQASSLTMQEVDSWVLKGDTILEEKP